MPFALGAGPAPKTRAGSGISSNWSEGLLRWAKGNSIEDWDEGIGEVGSIARNNHIVDERRGRRRWRKRGGRPKLIERDLGSGGRVIDSSRAARTASDEEKIAARVELHAERRFPCGRDKLGNVSGPQVAAKDLTQVCDGGRGCRRMYLATVD